MSDIADVGATIASHRVGVVPLSRLLHPERADELSSPHDLRATGFGPLDSLLAGGLAPEELVIVGGRPGVGKSVALVQWARNLAHSGRNVVLACYEHSELVVMAQLLLVEVGESVASGVESVAARAAVDQLIAGRKTWEQTIASDRTLAFAASQLDLVADRISILDRRGRSGGFHTLSNSVELADADVLIVDHLQKVGGSAGSVAIECKQLAVETSTTVVAAATSSDDGISSRRLRQAGLVDAATIAHEADIEILLNDKMSIVSRNHSAFDSVRAESFRSQVVFSVEKNRRGTAGVDLEFARDFAHRRFHSDGGFVSERLIDDILVLE
jgi:archaellum biogenesis ATPase FlaH